MKEEDFIIEDESIEQSVHLDEAAAAEPISLLIAVQCGRRAKREFGRMGGVATMLDPVLTGQNNEAALLLFDSGVNLVRDFTTQADGIEAATTGPPSSTPLFTEHVCSARGRKDSNACCY